MVKYTDIVIEIGPYPFVLVYAARIGIERSESSSNNAECTNKKTEEKFTFTAFDHRIQKQVRLSLRRNQAWSPK